MSYNYYSRATPCIKTQSYSFLVGKVASHSVEVDTHAFESTSNIFPLHANMTMNVLYSCQSDEINEWIERNILSRRKRVVGFDVEMKVR
jgi:hypothetical protein